MLIIRRSNCINTASGVVTLCKWPSGTPDGHLQRVTIPDAVPPDGHLQRVTIPDAVPPDGHLQRLTIPDAVPPDGHLQRVTIPDAVLIKFDLLMMSTTLQETCRGL